MILFIIRSTIKKLDFSHFIFTGIIGMDTRYFEYLSLLHLDADQEIISPNFRACKNESKLLSTNRVFISKRITKNDIQQLKDFYGNIPFTIWLDKNNLLAIEDIRQLSFEQFSSYPLMLANLKNINSYQTNPLIKINQILSKDLIINFWSDLVATAYNISIIEFRKFVTYLVSVNKFNHMKFYIGYFNNYPCCYEYAHTEK